MFMYIQRFKIRFSIILLLISLLSDFFLTLIIYFYFIYSIAGHFAGMIHMPVSVYCASKYAITGMSETLRNELRNAQIDVKVTVCKFFYIKKIVVKIESS